MTDPDGIGRAAELFRVLGSDSRLQLLLLIARSPAQVGALAEASGMRQPLVSQHLRTLRQAGLVQVERQGRAAVYALADHHVGHVIDDAIAHVLEPPTTTQTTIQEDDHDHD